MARFPSHRLIAFATSRSLMAAPEPAPRFRDWMNATYQRVANRCLPLLVANEHGWVLRNPATFTVTWDGGNATSALTVDYPDGIDVPQAQRAHSNFGHGVVTWSIPFLFRTHEGWNLLVRGPANHPKDGATALEGLVETDWSVSTFTMNWKLTRPHHPVTFEAGEPFCMLVPQQRGALEAFRPELRGIGSDEDAHAGLQAFIERRRASMLGRFLGHHAREYEHALSAWELDYFRGQRPDGTPAPEHQTKLRLAPFAAEPLAGQPAPGEEHATR